MQPKIKVSVKVLKTFSHDSWITTNLFSKITGAFLFRTFGGFLHLRTTQIYCLTGAIIGETRITNRYRYLPYIFKIQYTILHRRIESLLNCNTLYVLTFAGSALFPGDGGEVAIMSAAVQLTKKNAFQIRCPVARRPRSVAAY